MEISNQGGEILWVASGAGAWHDLIRTPLIMTAQNSPPRIQKTFYLSPLPGGETPPTAARVHAAGAHAPAPPPGAHAFHVFLSHSWGAAPDYENHTLVVNIGRALQRNGITCWIDEDQMTGFVHDTMARGVDDSACFAVFVTRDYADNINAAVQNNCKREFEYAKSMGKTFIPIVLGGGIGMGPVAGNLGMEVNGMLRYDFRTTEKRRANLPVVVRKIREGCAI